MNAGKEMYVAAATGTPALEFEMLVVFAVIAAALVLFFREPVPLDVTAIGVVVALILLEPWTEIDVEAGLSGFASQATVTVLAMFILSEGVRRTGVISELGNAISDRWGDSQFKQLAAVLGLSGGSAGFVNNTPVVAIMIPMVDEMSKRTGISPSRLLIPVSYASMLGGMITVIGTSTNILASDVSGRLSSDYAELHEFSMFEFTALGFAVLVVGVVYLLLVSERMLPERVKAASSLTEEFGMTDYLTEVVVRDDSEFVGKTVDECLAGVDIDADIVQLVRDDVSYTEPLGRKVVRGGDVIVMRTDRDSLRDLVEAKGLDLAPDAEVPADQLRGEDEREDAADQDLVEIVVTPDGRVKGRTLEQLRFRDRYDATVLAIRRGGRVVHARMDEHPLRPGDALLVQASADTVERLDRDRSFVVAQDVERPYRRRKVPVALAVVAGVVVFAASGLVSIVVAALAGVVAMVATGCVRSDEMYASVDWNVIFLLAGLIPLGLALERTGAAAWLAGNVASMSTGASTVTLLAVFYLFTAVVTNVVSNNASVVLMIPVAVDVALATGLNPFAFALAVTFAASTAFMTPVGYQTNLMVYGPGGYRFLDFVRVGGPLQLLLTVVTVLGIAGIWGIG
ncbi:MAG: SLC13 family permease [Halobacteriota archaeon]